MASIPYTNIGSSTNTPPTPTRRFTWRAMLLTIVGAATLTVLGVSAWDRYYVRRPTFAPMHELPHMYTGPDMSRMYAAPDMNPMHAPPAMPHMPNDMYRRDMHRMYRPDRINPTVERVVVPMTNSRDVPVQRYEPRRPVSAEHHYYAPRGADPMNPMNPPMGMPGMP